VCGLQPVMGVQAALRVGVGGGDGEHGVACYCYHIHIRIYTTHTHNRQGGGRVILADASQIATRSFWELYKPSLVVNAVGIDHRGFNYPDASRGGSFAMECGV